MTGTAFYFLLVLRENLNLRVSKNGELSEEGHVSKGDQGEWSCVLERTLIKIGLEVESRCLGKIVF